MCYQYCEVVVYKLPQLKYLDCVLIKAEEKEVDEMLLEEGTADGALCFYCYRIMGIEQPDRNDVWMKQVRAKDLVK